jgi:hypothetical protein
VTTGTLTEAMPAVGGQMWSTGRSGSRRIPNQLIYQKAQCLHPLRTPAIEFTKQQPLHRAGLRDHPRPADRSGDIADPAHQRGFADDGPQHIVFLYAILKRDQAGFGSDRGKQQLCCGFRCQSFTANRIRSTRPMLDGSSIAFTLGNSIGSCSFSTRSPCSASLQDAHRAREGLANATSKAFVARGQQPELRCTFQRWWTNRGQTGHWTLVVEVLKKPKKT